MGSIYLGFNLAGPIKSFLNFAFRAWNTIINKSYNMLTKLPGNIDGMSEILDDINVIFVGVGTSLVVLFFVIGFCQETVNVRDEMRYDSIVKYLIRLCMAEYFTIHSRKILVSILKCCKIFCKQLKSYFLKKNAKLHITDADKALIDDCGFGTSIVLLIVALIIGVLLIIMACSILYATYSRMLKLLILIPFGSLAFATMGGGGEVGRVSVTYLKSFMAVALEAVTISTALIFGTALMNYNPLDFGFKDGWLLVCGHLLSMLFQAAILTGTVKGAEQLTKGMIVGY